MTALSDMSVTEAASKALELLARGQYEKYSYKETYPNFKDFVINYYFDGDDEVYDSEKEDYVPVEEMTNFDTDSVWQIFHGEQSEGSFDGLTAKKVASYGGEGGGDQYWMVISLTDGLTTRYFRKDGYYASYDGGYLDGETYEVKPVEKTIVVYE